MVGRFSRIAIAGLILWGLWGARLFRPMQAGLPDGSVAVASLDGLRVLSADSAMVIEGRAFPAGTSPEESLWKGYFAYRLAIWGKGEFGGAEEIVRQEHRPAIRFEWAGGSLVVPAESYGLATAPRAPGDSVVLTTEHNVGFRPGDPAMVFGRKMPDESILVKELAVGPLEAYLEMLKDDNRVRRWVSHVLRGFASLLAIFILLSAFRPEKLALEEV